MPTSELDKFVPMWDYILMKPIPPGKSKGGLHMPDGVQHDDMQRSVVVKSGKGAYRESGVFIENPIKVGDLVYHVARVKPYVFKLDGETYLCVACRDCVAISVESPPEAQEE
jgi:co-chaperonin GroES (HSP10)